MANTASTNASALTAPAVIRARIATILNVPVDGPWTVVDQDYDNGVYLVSMKSHDEPMGEPGLFARDRIRPPVEYQNLRGVVVALGAAPEDDRRLVDNYVFTPRVQADRLTPTGELVTVTTQYGDNVTFDLTKATVRRYHEGVVIRLFVYNGVAYFATSSKLRALNGRWAPEPAPTFYQMYLEMGGAPLELVVEQRITENKVYSLLLVHPSMQMAVQSDPGAILILEVEALGEPGVHVEANLPFGYIPHGMSVADANQYLASGNVMPEAIIPVADPRLGHGEALLVTQMTESGPLALKIESPAYAWRSNVLGNTANRYQRFVNLLDVRSLSPEAYAVAWPDVISADGFTNPAETIWGRTLNMHACLVRASPYEQQPYVMSLLGRLFGYAPLAENGQPMYGLDPYNTSYEVDDFNGEIYATQEYLMTRMLQFTNRQLTEKLSGPTMKILETVRGETKPGVTSFEQQYLFYIHKFLYHPEGKFMISGAGLYKIMREMRTYNKFKAAPPA